MKKYLLIGLLVNVIFVLVAACSYWNASRTMPRPTEAALIEKGVGRLSNASGPQINEVAIQLFRDINGMYANYRGMVFCALNAISIVTVFNTILFGALLVQGRGAAEKSKG